MRSLAELVQDLPAELYNDILERVIAVEGEVEIDEDYKPPLGLQINRAIRNTTCEAHYKKATFYLQCDSEFVNYGLIGDWLCSLSCANLQALREIRLDFAVPFIRHDPIDDHQLDELRRNTACIMGTYTVTDDRLLGLEYWRFLHLEVQIPEEGNLIE